jgi:hypothetical protein
MFDNPSFQDMKNPPELEEGEKERFALKAQTEGGTGTIVAGTTERLFVGLKRGKRLGDEENVNIPLEIDINAIDAVRRYGALTKRIELICGDDVYELPKVTGGSDEIVEGILEQNELEKTSWSEENTVARGIKALITGAVGLASLLVGILGFLWGILMMFSGILISGALTAVGGGFFVKISTKLLNWGFNKNEEWASSAYLKTHERSNVECEKCGETISVDVSECPECGNNPAELMKGVSLSFVLLGGLLVLIWYGSGELQAALFGVFLVLIGGVVYTLEHSPSDYASPF